MASLLRTTQVAIPTFDSKYRRHVTLCVLVTPRIFPVPSEVLHAMFKDEKLTFSAVNLIKTLLSVFASK